MTRQAPKAVAIARGQTGPGNGAARPWYDGGTLYHIYPLSFADSNGDGFGDLQGIINHLDYLKGDDMGGLGVDAIWLSPIYRSPMADWGYDVADYCDVDPRLGTLADFDQLVASAHARGLRLLLDFVPNHTSVEHDWFKASRGSRLSRKRDWYVWADPAPGGGVPNNWLSRFGGPAWTLDETTGQYYMHTFLAEQPDLNWRNPEVRAAMEGVLRFWLARGVDGFRTDAVTSLFKDAQLRDNPPNPAYVEGKSDPADRYLQVYSAMPGGLTDVLGELCDVVATSGDGHLLLSEAYLDIPGMRTLYRACDAHPIHAPFNFNLITLPWGAASYGSFIDAYEASLRPQDIPNYVLGNHDQHRVASRLGGDRARLLAMLQLTLRGLPVVYYGDELGLADAKVGRAQTRDEWGERVGRPALGRDGERSPFPWTTGVQAGFTSGTPWLPLVDGAARVSLERQLRQPDSTWRLYHHLLHLRRSIPALGHGAYEGIRSGNPDVLTYMRRDGRQAVMVALNFSDHVQSIALAHQGVEIATTTVVDGSGLTLGGTLELGPYEGKVIEVNQL